MKQEIWEIRILLKTPTFSAPSRKKKKSAMFGNDSIFVIQMQLSRTSNIKLHKDVHYGVFVDEICFLANQLGLRFGK